MKIDNFCFYLQNRLIQTSQTGGQRYSDTAPFSILRLNNHSRDRTWDHQSIVLPTALPPPSKLFLVLLATNFFSFFQTAGYFLGYVFYMALESYKVLTLSDFLYFWRVVFMVATTLVAIFKHEDVVKEKVPTSWTFFLCRGLRQNKLECLSLATSLPFCALVFL